MQKNFKKKKPPLNKIKNKTNLYLQECKIKNMKNKRNNNNNSYSNRNNNKNNNHNYSFKSHQVRIYQKETLIRLLSCKIKFKA